MARRRIRAKSVPEAPPPIACDLAAVDALLGGRQMMAELDELIRQMKKVLHVRALSGELTHRLGHGRWAEKPAGQINRRNGTTPMTVLAEDGTMAIPRDREGSFTLQLIPKNTRRPPKFDKHWSRSTRTA